MSENINWPFAEMLLFLLDRLLIHILLTGHIRGDQFVCYLLLYISQVSPWSPIEWKSL